MYDNLREEKMVDISIYAPWAFTIMTTKEIQRLLRKHYYMSAYIYWDPL